MARWPRPASRRHGRPAPEPFRGYLPSCWRSRRAHRSRALPRRPSRSAGLRGARAVKARQDYATPSTGGNALVPLPGRGRLSRIEEWLDAGQCRDGSSCPPSTTGPPAPRSTCLGAPQLRRPGATRARFRFGFIGVERQPLGPRPGAGFKEFARRDHDRRTGPRWRGTPGSRASLLPDRGARCPSPCPTTPGSYRPTRSASRASDRGVRLLRDRRPDRRTRGARPHARSGRRSSAREVYATSGPRILLWFDLLTRRGRAAGRWAPRSRSSRTTPRFEVRAVGSFEQKPGCPADTRLSAVRAKSAWPSTCARASATTRPTRRRADLAHRGRAHPPAADRPDEPVNQLGGRPRGGSFPCPGDGAGCSRGVRGPGVRARGRATRPLLRARHRGAFDGRSTADNPLGCEPRRRTAECIRGRLRATATSAPATRTTASRRPSSGPGRRRSSWTGRARR